MSKNEMVKKLAFKTGLKQRDVRAVLNELTELAAHELRDNQVFSIHHLVTIAVKIWPARRILSPKNNFKEPVDVPPFYVIQARPCRRLKRLLPPLKPYKPTN